MCLADTSTTGPACLWPDQRANVIGNPGSRPKLPQSGSVADLTDKRGPEVPRLLQVNTGMELVDRQVTRDAYLVLFTRQRNPRAVL